MEDKVKDGGAAFPHQHCNPQGMPNAPEPGMSLRDWFAGQALAGMLSRKLEVSVTTEHEAYRVIGLAAYAFADALLSARGEPK